MHIRGIRIFSAAFLCYVFPFHFIASLDSSMATRRISVPKQHCAGRSCSFQAVLLLSFPRHIVSILVLSLASHLYVSLFHRNIIQFISAAEPSISFPPQFYAVPWPHTSLRCNSSAQPTICMLFLCCCVPHVTIRCHCFSNRFYSLATPLPLDSIHFLAIPMRSSLVLFNSFADLTGAVPRLCHSMLLTAFAY